MRQLMYVSAARGRPATADLNAILAVARRNNAAAQVTGMLVYLDQGFLQILEGPHDSVQKIYDQIAKDERHTGLLVLMDHDVPARLFADWSMGFEQLTPGQSNASVFALTRDALQHKVPREGAPEIAALLHTFFVVNGKEQAA